MAGGAPVLSRLAGLGTGRGEEPLDCGYSVDFPGPVVSLLQRERELQGCGGGLRVNDVSRHGFVWSAYDFIWLRLSRHSAHHSATLPEQRSRSSVADSALILSVDKHPRIVVLGFDCVRHHRRGRSFQGYLGTFGG